MMAGGTWNNGGATPAHHNAYTKVYTYGWATPHILNKADTITMLNSIEHDNHFYRINTDTPGEYYLLENRHHIGFDTHIPGEGLIIYHVHKEVATSGNQVNVGHPQKMYPVSAGASGDPTGPPWSYGNINSTETPFPGSTNQKSFTDDTAPNALSWAGDNTHKPLTHISRDATNQTVSFHFMEDAGTSFDWVHWDDGIHEGSVGLGGGGVYQIAQRFAPADLEAYQGLQINMLRFHVGDAPTQAAIKIWQGESQDSLQEVVHQEFSPEGGTWTEIILDEPHVIDTGQELWFGLEYDDPGEGVFSASRDIHTDHDGKGNLIRMDVEDPEAWTALSEYDIEGDWNIQARTGLADQLMVSFSPEDAYGDITAVANGAEISSGETLPQGTPITFFAHPDEGFEVSAWTKNGQHLEGHMTDSLYISGLATNLEVTIAFDHIYHVVDYYVDGANGQLTALVDNQELAAGDEVQQGQDVHFVAEPDEGYRIAAWYLNGELADDSENTQYQIVINEDVTVTITFEEAVSAPDMAITEMQVYPNPVRDNLHIKADAPITELRLICMKGQVIYQGTPRSREADISMQDVPTGMYLLQVQAGGRTANKIIQRIKN